MRIFFLIVILFFISNSQVNSQNVRLQRKAQKEYLRIIKDIERKCKKKKVIGEDMEMLVTLLEKLTGVISYVHKEENYMSYSFIIPNNYNIRDWKDWYDLNKNNLIWDSSTKEICLIRASENLRKDPISEYEKYISIIDLDYTNYYTVSENLFDYAYNFIENLTGYIVKYDHTYGFKYPTPKDLLFLKDWLQKNKVNLFWDEYDQKVKLKD